MPKKPAPARREYETHYFYDARLAYPSMDRGYAASEEGAKARCVVKVDAEKFNKAMIVHRDTLEVLHVYRRDPRTGFIDREDHRYQKLLGIKPRKVEKPQ